MNRILLASHGPLAKGMKDTLAILAGENDRIETLCAYVDDQSRDVAKMIDAWEAGLDPDDRWIVVTDVFGGSVNNEFLLRLSGGAFTLVAGMNLPLLVELSVTLDSLDEAALDRAIDSCRASIQRCMPPIVGEDEDEDF